VDRDDQSAKFWLKPVQHSRNIGFSPHELRRIQRLLEGEQERLLGAWNENLGA